MNVPTHDIDIAAHMGLVHRIARKRWTNDPAVELADIVSVGTLGLIEAAERFDPSRGLKFSTYAVPCIRGAIGEMFRRHRSIELVGQQADLTHRMDAESASTKDNNGIEFFVCPRALAIDELLFTERVRRERHAVTLLPARERFVIECYFFKSMLLQDIGELLGVTASRVTQLKRQALATLAITLSDMSDEAHPIAA